MVSNLLNTSVTKESHGFTRASRFPKLTQNTGQVSWHTFNKLSDFDRTVRVGKDKEKHSFGNRNGRFTYYPNDSKQDDHNCSHISFEALSTFSPRQTNRNSVKYSLRTGRAQMQTLFIDDVNSQAQKELLSPGPGNYQLKPTFGDSGRHTSFLQRYYKSGMRNDQFDLSFFKIEEQKPGPGTYETAKHTVGQDRSASSLTQVAPKYGFTKTKNRFFMPTKSPQRSPSPVSYSPQVALGKDTISRTLHYPRTVIGRDNSDVLDKKYHIKERNLIPGPGKYERFSEFHPRV